MKIFKTVSIPEEDPEALYLVNIDNEEDRYMATDDFSVGELVSEDMIVFEEWNYVDKQGSGTGIFAFKRR